LLGVVEWTVASTGSRGVEIVPEVVGAASYGGSRETSE
jgi:hypothetical protein